MSDQPRCPLHSGVKAELEEVCRRCNLLDESSKEKWNTIHKKVSTTTLIIVAIFVLGVIGSLFGLLYKGQADISHELKMMNFTLIKVEAKVDQHIKDGGRD